MAEAIVARDVLTIVYGLQGLAADGASLAIYDPKVSAAQIQKDLGSAYEAVTVFKDPYEACKGAHALCILTEWDEFAAYDFEKLYSSMMKPAFCFDG